MGCLYAFDNGEPMLRNISTPFLNALDDTQQVGISRESLCQTTRVHYTIFGFQNGCIRRQRTGASLNLKKKAPRNSTHQHIFLYAVESKLGPKITFCWVKTWSNFSYFPFCLKNLLSAGRMRFSEKRKNWQNLPFFWVTTWSSMLRNMLGPSLDSTLDQVLTQPFWQCLAFFAFCKTCWNHYVCGVFSKICIFNAHPSKLGTRFVNTTARTEKNSAFFSAFLCFGVFAVSRLFVLFWEEKQKTKIQNKQQKRKHNHKMQTRKPLGLVTKKESRQQRHKTIQPHCLDCK